MMTTQMRRASLLATAALAAIALPIGSAAAQEEGSATSDDGTIGEIVVTAQFRDQSLQKTPIAITAIDAEALEQRSQTDISQVAAQAPNVTLKAAGASSGSSLVAFIRGVGQTDFNLALEPGVGVYVDDVYYSTIAGSVLDLLDVERVEVLRGPQGTLAGKNSIGGAIKMFSKKPTGDGSGYVEATYGSYDRMGVRGAVDLTLVEDQLFARVAAVAKKRDGYITRLDYACSHPGSGLPTLVTGADCELGTEGGQSYTAVRLSLRWLPTSTLDVNLMADVVDDNSEVQAGTILYANNPNVTQNGVPFDCRFVPYGTNSCDPNAPNDPYLSYSTYVDARPATPQQPFKPVVIPPINHYSQWSIAGTVDWELSDDFQVKSITAYKKYENHFADDIDASPIGVQLLLQNLRHHSFQQELRLNGRIGPSVEFTLGGFYFDQNGTLDARVDLGYAGLDFAHGKDPTPATTWAAFAHASWEITDRLQVAGGVRYSDETKDYTFHRRNPDGTLPAPCVVGPPANPLNPPNCALAGLDGQTGHFEGTRWDYRADVSYQLTDDIMAYAQYSTGYKGGGINPRPFFASQILSFEPETLTAYELGLKSFLFDRRLRLNAAAFFNKYDNIQLTLARCDAFSPFPGAPCFMPANAGDAEVKGWEVELEARPVGGLLIDAAVSNLDFEYQRVEAVTGVQLGMITPYTPEWKWSAGIQYEFDLGNRGSLTPRLDASYQSEVYTNPVNTAFNRIDGYTLANGRLTWRAADQDWQLSLEVTNIFDKLYYLTNYDQSQPGRAGLVQAQPGRPREWALTVKKRF